MADLLVDIAEAERTLLVCREVLIYKLPPRASAAGHKAQDWPKENWLFTGRLRIVAVGEQATLIIEDPNTGELFAKCPYDNDHPATCVEPVTDSSRYFVIRVSSDDGRHAYLGMGFRERPEAFDFNVALQDHIKQVFAAKAGVSAAASLGDDAQGPGAPAQPTRDLSLKDGERITVNIGGRGAARPAQPRPAAGDGGGGGLTALPPPPALPAPPGGGDRRRQVPSRPS